jgi:cobaltochelatase CobS
MAVSDRLQELIKSTSIAPAPTGYAGKVSLSQLGDDVLEYLKKTQKVEFVLPNDIRTHDSTTSVRHKDFYKIIDDLILGNNVFLVGEAGTGKTTLAKKIANAMYPKKNHYKTINCNEWTSPRQIIGGDTVDGYKQGTLVECWIEGKMLVLDEMTKLNPNTAGLLNDALAQAADKDAIIFDAAGVAHEKHPGFKVVATANIVGKVESPKYAGNNKQDGSLLDRFSGSIYFVEFDRDLEYANTFSAVFEICDKMRTVLQEMESQDFITLRTMLNFNRIYHQEMERELGNVPNVQGGKTLKDCIESYLDSMADPDEAKELREKANTERFYNTYKDRSKYLTDKKRLFKV